MRASSSRSLMQRGAPGTVAAEASANGLTRKHHGSVEMVQIEGLRTRHAVCLTPTLARRLDHYRKQTVDEELSGRRHARRRTRSTRERNSCWRTLPIPRFLPEPPEDEDPYRLRLTDHRLGLTSGMGIEDGDFLAESQTGTKQGIELAGRLQDIEANLRVERTRCCTRLS